VVSMKDMFGVDDVDAFVKQMEETPLYHLGGPGMMIMSILSDAQELIEVGRKNEARQYINVAKHMVLRHLKPPEPTRELLSNIARNRKEKKT